MFAIYPACKAEPTGLEGSHCYQEARLTETNIDIVLLTQMVTSPDRLQAVKKDFIEIMLNMPLFAKGVKPLHL